MESPRKFNDCYFYYYSTCTKGDNCVFRHEPSALGCETMCTAWQQGKCLDKRCKLRHMELRKNRKQIPCYWENQPGGCRKIHCPFMHKNPDARTDGIAPSQPAPPVPTGGAVPAHGEGIVGGEPQLAAVPAPAPVPAPVPLLWQQQRQEHLPGVVLESPMLGVLPASSELRRMLAPHSHAPHTHPDPTPLPYSHAHSHAHSHPHAHPQLPVDPLVVNFEEESDNESVPSSTPTKDGSPEDAHNNIARSKSQELLLLEKIQAEAAAFYNYDALLPVPDKKIVRTNLNNKYERLSLDEIAGKKQPTQERRTSLDFKVLSLDEIRARKKSDTIPLCSPQITLNLRKRKLSTHETVTSAGNKIIKVVRSNSIVYKKLDKTPQTTTQSKVHKPNNTNENARKRTISEQSDIFEVHDDELIDNCYEFKRIKITEQTVQNKPRLIRNRNISERKNSEREASVSISEELHLDDVDSDNEVQIVSVEHVSENIDLDKIYTDDIIDVETSKFGDPIDIVDLSDDETNTDLITNVPDVVASCQKSTKNDKIDQRIVEIDDSIEKNDLDSEKKVINDIDAFINNDS